MPGMDVRPTPDKMRETLFNILSPEIEGRCSWMPTRAPARSGSKL